MKSRGLTSSYAVKNRTDLNQTRDREERWKYHAQYNCRKLNNPYEISIHNLHSKFVNHNIKMLSNIPYEQISNMTQSISDQ